jgi:hypothetical protein
MIRYEITGIKENENEEGREMDLPEPRRTPCVASRPKPSPS